MSKYVSGKIDLDIKALEPICHGERTSGNHTLLRTRSIVHANRITQIPFLSANSVRHLIREAGAKHALEVMEVEDGTLSQALIDLIGSGGQLSKKGTVVNAKKARELEANFPVLKLLGYSAGNTIWEGALKVSHWNLVCAENAEDLPDWLAAETATLATYSAWDYRTEEMGVRMDAKRIPLFERKLLVQTQRQLLDTAAEKLDLKAKGKKDPDEIRMMFTFEAIAKGARLYGDIIYRDLTEMDLCCLVAALSYATIGKTTDGRYIYLVGAKTSGGFGRVGIRFQSSRKLDIKPVEFVPDDAALSIGNESMVDVYTNHLRRNREAIIQALKEAVL